MVKDLLRRMASARAIAGLAYSLLVAALAAASFDANRMLIQTSDSMSKASTVIRNVSEGGLDLPYHSPHIVRTVTGNQPEQVFTSSLPW